MIDALRTVNCCTDAELCLVTTPERTVTLRRTSAHVANIVSTRMSNMELNAGPLTRGDPCCRSLLDMYERVRCVLLP
jgi:hypothetical protein